LKSRGVAALSRSYSHRGLLPHRGRSGLRLTSPWSLRRHPLRPPFNAAACLLPYLVTARAFVVSLLARIRVSFLRRKDGFHTTTHQEHQVRKERDADLNQGRAWQVSCPCLARGKILAHAAQHRFPLLSHRWCRLVSWWLKSFLPSHALNLSAASVSWARSAHPRDFSSKSGLIPAPALVCGEVEAFARGRQDLADGRGDAARHAAVGPRCCEHGSQAYSAHRAFAATPPRSRRPAPPFPSAPSPVGAHLRGMIDGSHVASSPFRAEAQCRDLRVGNAGRAKCLE